MTEFQPSLVKYNIGFDLPEDSTIGLTSILYWYIRQFKQFLSTYTTGSSVYKNRIATLPIEK